MKMKKDKLVSILEANDIDPTVLSDPEFNEECKTYAAHGDKIISNAFLFTMIN